MRKKIYWLFRRYRVEISIAYMLAMLVLAAVKGFFAMPLLDMADFIADAATPLAFYWLFIFYHEQRRVLKQSEEIAQLQSEAFRMQAEEFKTAIAQQQQLIETNRRRIEEYQSTELLRKKNLQPKIEVFKAGCIDEYGLVHAAVIQNTKESCFDVEMHLLEDLAVKDVTAEQKDVLDKGDVMKIVWRYASRPRNLNLVVNYTDREGERNEVRFLLGYSEQNPKDFLITQVV